MYPEFTITPFGRYDRKQQQSLLNIIGDGNLIGSTEIQNIGYSGTRSNVFVPANNEIVTVNLLNEFNSGLTQTNTPLNLTTTSDSVLHSIGDTYSWPTGDLGDASLPDGWDYTPGLGSGGLSDNVEGMITNNTGGSVSVVNGNMSVTINISSLPVSGSAQPGIIISYNNVVTFIFSNVLPVITETGSYTFTDLTSDFSAPILDGDFFSLVIFENITEEQGFEYTITDVSINTGASSATSYVLNMDVDNNTFPGNVTNTLGNELTATASVTSIANAVTTMFPSITSGTVYDSLVPETASRDTISGKQDSGNITTFQWGLRTTGVDGSLSALYTSWDDWIGNFFSLGGGFGDYGDLVATALAEGNFSNMVLTVSDRTDATVTATFVVDILSSTSGSDDIYMRLQSITSQTGVPLQSGNVTAIFTADVGSKAIDLDTNQSANLSQMLTLTPNTGSDIMGEVSASDGTPANGQASTYTIVDAYGSEITSFTSSVALASDADIASVISTIVGAINSNTETPIDFTAASDGSNVVITAAIAGEIPGLWNISVNHHSQANNIGDIDFNTTTIMTEGGNPTITISGGGLTQDIIIVSTLFTKSILLTVLGDALKVGATQYDDPDGDFALLSSSFAEHPEISVVVSGATNNPFTFLTPVKYWGHE